MENNKMIIFNAIDDLDFKKVVVWSDKKEDIQNAFWDSVLLDLLDSNQITEQQAEIAYNDDEMIEYFYNLHQWRD